MSLGALKRSYGLDTLNNLELLLEQIHRLDLSLFGDIKSLKHDSTIVSFRVLFIPVLRKFDFKKVSKKDLDVFLFHLKNLNSLETEAIKYLSTVSEVVHNEKTRHHDMKFITFIKHDLIHIFEYSRELSSLLNDFLEIPSVLEKNNYSDLSSEEINEFKKDYDKIYVLIEKIRTISAELIHYSKFLESRLKSDFRFDVHYVSKSKDYLDEFENFQSLQKDIILTEHNIESFPKNNKLHSALTKQTIVSTRNCLKYPFHARVNKNIRIIYAWDIDKKEIHYLHVVTHDQMERWDNVKGHRW